MSIQGLHPFYQRRTNRVVVSWMTSQNRDAAIADNIAYVDNCISAIRAEWATSPVVVFTGFSQGVAMAFRAAANSRSHTAGVISVGSDIPPELEPASLQRISGVLLVRGAADEWYTQEKFAADQKRLRDCAVKVKAVETSGGHEWSADVSAAAGEFLRELSS